jgi:tetratricopeptide (TPR) repeat protein
MHLANVAPIGTCRIHTPLRRAASVFPFELNLTRNYGFVHTSAEVLQQLDVVVGGSAVPSGLWPLIYRPNTTAEFLARPPRPVDKFFFEISSAKHVTVDRTPVQLNYVTRHFGEFFAETAIARKFWAMARDEDAASRLAWLQTVPQYGRLPEDDRRILAAIRMREQTAEEIADDMAAIVERVGADKAVFVTHVNALTPDNAPIASRRRLIDLVEKSAAALNVPCFNPSTHMNAFGQANAMERQGLDLTHFTLPFADHLGKTWFEKYVRHSGGISDAAYLERIKRSHDEIAALQSQLEAGRIIDVSRALHAAHRAGEATDDHDRLLSQVAFTLGDFERTASLLQNLRNANGAHEEDDILLMNAYLAQGDNLGAINLGRSLLADERESDEILEACAVAAQNLGLLHEALVYRRRLVRSGAPGPHAAALMTQLLQMQEFDEADKVADATLAIRADDLPSLQAKWQVALARRDNSALARLAQSLSALDDEATLGLVRTTWESGFARPAATLLAVRLRQLPVPKAILELARQLGEIWHADGMAAFEAGDLQRAADFLGAGIELAPDSGTSIRTARALQRRMRAEVREAFAAKDYQRVMALADVALANSLSFNGFERLVGRSAAELGKCDIALPYLRKVAEMDPGHDSRLQFARTAAKAKRYDEALAAFNGVLKDPAATPAQHDKALRAVVGMYSGAVNAAREAIAGGNVDLAWKLLKLLAANSDKADQIKREQARIIRQLRLELNASDASEHATRLEMANTVLSLDPTDIGARRIAAVAAMRTLNFNEAREHWRTLARQAELTPQIESAIAKCDLWIARDQLRKAA